MSTIRFESTILKPDSRALVLEVPKSAHAKLPEDGTMVEGVVNHFPFRAALDRDGITISNGIREGARSDVGDTVAVELTRIGDEQETRVPVDLHSALSANPKAEAAWTKITPMARRDWILSILVVRQLETREIRLAKTCGMLASGKGRICCFPGINWLTRDFVGPEETWLPLHKPSVSAS